MSRDKESLKAMAKAKAQKIKQAAQTAKASKGAPVLVNMPATVGNAERDSLAELDAVKKGFRSRVKVENERFKNVIDSEYWFAVCFRTREQKARFLEAMQWVELGDKYLPGDEIAKRMGIDLPASNIRKTDPKIDEDYARLSI